jgi:hypothetical protein
VIAPHPVTHEGHGVRLEPLTHAFETLGCRVNAASQKAIAALGARKDGVIRHHQARRDGTVRDTVMYSILADEWPAVKEHLAARLARHGSDR